MKKTLFATLFLILAASGSQAGEPIVIMPVGNSITAGEHYGYPPIQEREGFRRPLYEMLVDSGYNIDFVGSQLHGERLETDTNWYDWHNEGYPGWKIPDIARKTQEALVLYEPDILLVHVGTNGSVWEDKPGQVMAMLDSINKFSVDNDHPITVFLCQIIGRYYLEDTVGIEPGELPLTSQFNIAVTDTVATRTGDKIDIILVDMENGAGLDYSDSLPDPTAEPPYEGGDMWGMLYPNVSYDKFHPNHKGNYKMALRYYEELVKELPEPEMIENNFVEGIALSATNDSSIKVTWIANFVDEDGYIVERSESGAAFAIVDTVEANTRCFIDTTANATNEYTYRIKAYNATGESLYSEEITYSPMYYNLTMLVEGEGTVTPGDGPYLVGANTVVSLTGIPEEGWEFWNWTGDISSFRYSNPTSIIMDSDKEITGNFREIELQASTETNSLHRFYPNPVSDILFIELQDNFSHSAVIELLDQTGRSIIQKKVQGSKHIVNMENLCSGIYFIKVSEFDQETIIVSIAKQ